VSGVRIVENRRVAGRFAAKRLLIVGNAENLQRVLRFSA
jgi:hypothetical protein